MKTRYLEFKWTISRAQETYGYNIVTLQGTHTSKKFRAVGGGYDMQGAVFGEWLQATYPKELRANRAEIGDLSGAYVDDDGVNLDGSCGLETMIEIAEVIGSYGFGERVSSDSRRKIAWCDMIILS